MKDIKKITPPRYSEKIERDICAYKFNIASSLAHDMELKEDNMLGLEAWFYTRLHECYEGQDVDVNNKFDILFLQIGYLLLLLGIDFALEILQDETAEEQWLDFASRICDFELVDKDSELARVNYVFYKKYRKLMQIFFFRVVESSIDFTEKKLNLILGTKK